MADPSVASLVGIAKFLELSGHQWRAWVVREAASRLAEGTRGQMVGVDWASGLVC